MYIRTKDGRIITFGEKYAYPTKLSNGKTYFSFQELTEDRFEVMKEYNHWEILNQSDIIEELFDEFVYVVNDTIHKLILGEHSLEEAIEETKTYSKRTIYGAIWTNKGLIYVAKMDDEGDWELL